ncbi:MAG: hypothetical protein K9M51_01695 [Candidatus Gracilibacteria bacterium]|nr:hypothetical protein [Candidatus Gracilibacteria bacterium]
MVPEKIPAPGKNYNPDDYKLPPEVLEEARRKAKEMVEKNRAVFNHDDPSFETDRITI